jgi:cytidyltransferase-like protein
LYKVILANGVFDILHIGHLMYLEQASRMGDKLVVAVTRNAYVNKGPHRPNWDEMHRVALVGALRCVDEAILVDGAIEAFERVKPDIFVKGRDYVGKIEKRHVDYCAAHGIEIAFTDTQLFSATKVIRDRVKKG